MPAAAGFAGSSASPSNVLGTLALEPPSALAATARPDGTIALAWVASPSAAIRPIEYAVLRRPFGPGPFVEIARTGLLGYVDVTYVDAPPAGTYDYAARTLVSTFTSSDAPSITVSTIP